MCPLRKLWFSARTCTWIGFSLLFPPCRRSSNGFRQTGPRHPFCSPTGASICGNGLHAPQHPPLGSVYIPGLHKVSSSDATITRWAMYIAGVTLSGCGEPCDSYGATIVKRTVRILLLLIPWTLLGQQYDVLIRNGRVVDGTKRRIAVPKVSKVSAAGESGP